MIPFSPVPVFSLGPVNISVHGILMAVGFLVAAILGMRAAIRRGLSPSVVEGMSAVAVVAGLIGARVAFILTLGQSMTAVEMLRMWDGGMSSHGGYIFGAAAAIAYLKIKKQPVWAYTDLLAPYFLLGWAIGRIGCFLNWDSYGRIASDAWLFTVRVYGEVRYPTQLYESVLAVLGAASLLLLRRRANLPAGAVTALSLVWFSAVRFVTDFLRDDAASYILFSRTVSLAVFAVGFFMIIRLVVNSVKKWYPK